MTLYRPPAILVTPLEDLLLQMKAMGIESLDMFPFPTKPPEISLRKASQLLTHMGAIRRRYLPPVSSIDVLNNMEKYRGIIESFQHQLQIRGGSETASQRTKTQQQIDQQRILELITFQQHGTGDITGLGRLMAKCPVNPRFAKMLIVAYQSAEEEVSLALRSNSAQKKKHKAKEESIAVEGDTCARIMAARVVQLTLSLVSVLAERSPFMHNEISELNAGRKRKRRAGGDRGGDRDDSDEGDSDDDDDDSDDDASSSDDDDKEKTNAGLCWHPGGDAMARLRAVGAFAFSASRFSASDDSKTRQSDGRNGRNELPKATKLDKFCFEQRLHKQTLERSMDLRGQLDRVLGVAMEDKMGNLEADVNKEHASSADKVGRSSQVRQVVEMKPPDASEEVALRQMILTGYPDCIAKRAPPGTVKEGSRRARLTGYLSADPNITEPLYIHPQSALYKKDPTAPLPDYVVYTSLVRNHANDTTYMVCVSQVQPAWISALTRDSPLLHWSPPMTSPTPFYDAHTDTLMCYVSPSYGVYRWDLPPVKRPMRDCIDNGDTPNDSATASSTLLGKKSSASGSGSFAPVGYRKQDEPFRWFARTLLEGHVISGHPVALSLRAEHMKESPQAFTQMKPLPAVANLLRSIAENGVCSKKMLINLLRESAGKKLFLQEEIEQLLKLEKRSAFRKSWALLSEE
jgi:hypothetical protein